MGYVGQDEERQVDDQSESWPLTVAEVGKALVLAVWGTLRDIRYV